MATRFQVAISSLLVMLELKLPVEEDGNAANRAICRSRKRL